MIITREKGMRMWGGGSGSTSASGVNGGGGFSLAVTEGEGTGNAYTDFTYESGTLTLNKATEFVTVDFFNKLFTAYDANGNAIVPNDTTTAINNLKLMVGTWTEQYLSALGSNSEGGGSGAGLEDVWDSLTNQQGTVITDNTKIAIAHIPDTSSTYGYLKSSALNGYATQSWVNQQGFLTTHQTLYTLSIYGGTTKVLDFKPNANASIYIKAGGDISLANDTTNKYITLSYTHPTNGANTTISAASGKVLSAITVNNLGHVTSVSSKTLAAADIPDLSATYATASRATTLEGYFTNGVAKTAAKLNTGTTTYTAWGQTYWSSGVPQSISGNMTSVGSITPSANGNALGTTSARFNIYGTSGNFSGNVSVGGTLGVTGATTLSSTLSVAGGITLTTTKKIYFGDTSHYLELDSTGFHFSHGVYSDSFVSALGANSSGGGSGADLSEVWDSLTNQTGTTPTSTTKIAVAHIPDISSTYGYAKTSQLGNYLPLVGGTLTGVLTISTGADRKLIINNTDSETKDSLISFQQNGTEYGTLGTWGNDNLLWKGNIIINTNNIGSYALPLSGGTMESAAIIRCRRVLTNLSNGNSGMWTGSYYTGSLSEDDVVITTATPSSDKIALLAGYVGIGTYTPAYKLDVDGDVRASNFRGSLIGNAATATKATQDGSGNTITSTYLPLSGGTLTGGLQVEGALYTKGFNHMIKFDVDTSRALGYGWWDTNSNIVASIVYHNTVQNIILNPIGSASVYSDAVGKYSLIIGNNKLTYNTYTILHSNNTYVSSGKGYINGTEITTISGNAATASLLSYSHGNEINFKGDMQASCFFNYRNADTGNEDGGTTAINYKFCNYSRSTAYSTVTAGTFVGAFSGNATTATTLQTPRTIWGQSFDGSSNVSGSITGATTITASGRISASAFKGNFVTDGTVFYFGNSQHAIGSGTDAVLYAYGTNSLLFYTNSLRRMTINSEGSVGIGTTSPSSKLHVTGNILASGEITASSDGRKKNIISNTKFNVKDIASARSIIYEWNDDRDKDNSKKIHGGSIAQDWLGKADSFLSQDNDGWYSINYGALALCSAITIAREVVKHDDEITRLKKEVVKLRERVAELEERRA